MTLRRTVSAPVTVPTRRQRPSDIHGELERLVVSSGEDSGSGEDSDGGTGRGGGGWMFSGLGKRKVVGARERRRRRASVDFTSGGSIREEAVEVAKE